MREPKRAFLLVRTQSGEFLQWMHHTQRNFAKREALRGSGGAGRRVVAGRLSRNCERRGTVWARKVLYNEIKFLRSEATVVEQLVLGAFLVIPLVIVAFLFSDELWQEYRQLHDMQSRPVRPHRIDWRHPLRRSRPRF
ncbi:hypothetical protein [Paraburkholderia fungorum]|uniref:hypothetical protein n=1 Tax=Paraburkholderia fungorum TaxID=134537 RepID=UPI0038BADEAD